MCSPGGGAGQARVVGARSWEARLWIVKLTEAARAADNGNGVCSRGHG